MANPSPCVSCPRAAEGFCGAVLGTVSDKPASSDASDWQRHRMVSAGASVVARHQTSDDIFVLCIGWGFRFIRLADGSRRILNFLLPGDLFSSALVFEERVHFSVDALTAIQISEMRRTEVQSRVRRNPDVLRQLAKSWALESEASDEMLTVLGKSSAEKKIAYLLLRLVRRIAARSVIRDLIYPFPLRQQHIADAVGLTAVHVSRVFSQLRDRGVLELSDGVLKVHDLAELERLGSLS